MLHYNLVIFFFVISHLTLLNFEVLSENDIFRKYKIVSTRIVPTTAASLKNVSSKYINYTNCKTLRLTILTTKHEFCLLSKRPTNNNYENIQIQIMGNINQSKSFIEYPFEDDTLINGFDLTHPFSSSIKGFVYNKYFYGQIQIRDQLYFLERIAKYPYIMKTNRIQNENLAILYHQNDYKLPVDILHQHFVFRNMTYSKLNKGTKRKKRSVNEKMIGKLCTVLLMADNTYLHLMASDNIKLATLEMITYLKEAEAIFRRTDFDEDGYADNIGFRIKFIVVLTDNQLSRMPIGNQSTVVDPNNYLISLSYIESLKEVCLGIAYTSNTFSNHVLGVSFTAVSRETTNTVVYGGGICEFPTKTSEHLNLLAISTMFNSKNKVPQIMIILATAHEIGHSFGGVHDINKSEFLNYLMSPVSGDGKNPRNFRFSKPSRENINQLIHTKYKQCFENSTEPYCGNELVEQGEDCDCGLYVDCISRDPCCYPRGSGSQACHINDIQGTECHPSQGLCCSSECKFRNLSHMGVDCRSIPNTCPCVDYNQGNCNCGYFGQCVKDTCHSIECTRLGLTECLCPKVNSNRCNICCKLNTSECLPVIDASKSALRDKSLYLELKQNLILYASKTGNMITEDYCLDDEENCIQLQHQTWATDTFCIFHGRIGRCSNGQCYATHPLKQIYPAFKIRSINTQNNCAIKNYSYSLIWELCIWVLYYAVYLLQLNTIIY